MKTHNNGRQILSLNGDEWRLTRATKKKGHFSSDAAWLPASVPGDVHLDLARAGQLPDVQWGQNSLEAHWVDAQDWWLVRDLECSEFAPDRRVFLRLWGVDYVSDVYFNGRNLGRHEGMFSPQLYEVTRCLTPPSKAGVLADKLALRVTGTARLPFNRADRLTRWRDRREQRLVPSNRWPHRRSVLKCQMGFGWDFAPDLPGLGIWDDVEMVITGDAFICSMQARPVFSDASGSAVRLDVTLELDARGHYQAEVGLNLFGLNCDAPPMLQVFPVNLHPGRQQLNFSLNVPDPQLWWPWDHGSPDLYQILVTVRRRAELLDQCSQSVGLRQIQMAPNPGAPQDASPWVCVVNGQRIFLRGANWVPASIFPGQVTSDDYKALIELARQANMNALRVWGGGLREKVAFYDFCDRQGLLVWQDLPFACAFFTNYPQSKEYLELVDRETRAIVRTLRHHPSIFLWCGGNEFDPTRNKPLIETLSAAIAAEDPTRPFVPVSPAGGDNHNWHIWHGFAPLTDYVQDASQFVSEFGLQAPPVKETLAQFIPPEELWPPGPSWAHHNADWPKLWRYAAPLLDGRDTPEQVTLDEFLAASQRAQALGLQIAIEHYRRRKYACGGCLLWQFNSPWPAVEWALIDHFRRPKPAYEVVKRLYAPVLVTLEYPPGAYEPGAPFSPTVWVVNDRNKSLPGCRLVIALETAQDAATETAQDVALGTAQDVALETAQDAALEKTPVTTLQRLEQVIDLTADSVTRVTQFSWTLPQADTALWVRCRLYQGETLLSFNEYDLSVHDSGSPSRWQRLRSELGHRLLGMD